MAPLTLTAESPEHESCGFSHSQLAIMDRQPKVAVSGTQGEPLGLDAHRVKHAVRPLPGRSHTTQFSPPLSWYLLGAPPQETVTHALHMARGSLQC